MIRRIKNFYFVKIKSKTHELCKNFGVPIDRFLQTILSGFFSRLRPLKIPFIGAGKIKNGRYDR